MIEPKKPVESTTGAYCTESKAFFTFLKLTHGVTWVVSKKVGRLNKTNIRSIFSTLAPLATIQLIFLGLKIQA